MKELGDYYQKEGREYGQGVMISVTFVKVAADLSNAKIYVSIFPPEKAKAVFEVIKQKSWNARHVLAQNTRNQLRRIPDFEFFIDDSLDTIERIDQLLNQ